MATPSPTPGQNPPSTLDRIGQLMDQVGVAIQNVDRRQADPAMAEIRALLTPEFVEVNPEVAKAVNALIETSECIFILFSSLSMPELRSVVERMEKCKESNSPSTTASQETVQRFRDWQIGLETLILYGTMKLRRMELAEINADVRQLEVSFIQHLGAGAERQTADSDDRLYTEGLMKYIQASQLIVKAASSQAGMELDIAAANLQDALNTLKESSERFKAMSRSNKFTMLMMGMASEFEKWVEAQKIYTTVLQKALTGGASAESLSDLQRAEGMFIETGIRMQERSADLERLIHSGAEVNFKEVGEGLSRISRNLRQLCYSALRPKTVAVQATPRMLTFFIITFAGVLAGLRLSGLVTELGSAAVTTVVSLSFGVSAFSSYGLEGVRVVRALLAGRQAMASTT